MTLTLVMPMPALMTNQLRHWRTVAARKKKYFAVLDSMQRVGTLPPPPPAPITAANLTSVMRLGAAMDQDNAMARHKWPLDWLKTRGYIADDRRQNIRWVGFPEQIIGRKQEYSITLILTPVAA